jgi:mono/diheme cytochrome c family protein
LYRNIEEIKNLHMKRVFLIAATSILILASSCGGDAKKADGTESAGGSSSAPATTPSDPNRGIGKFTTVDLGSTIDRKMVEAGQKIFDVKCSACHKLTGEKLVGPGWKGVTTRRAPVWIMNFATNVDVMLANDPQAQAQLEICLIRMPNQNLSDDDARHILEFMRNNDAAK